MERIFNVIVILGCFLMMAFVLEASQSAVEHASPEQQLAEEAFQQFLSVVTAKELHQFIYTWSNYDRGLRQFSHGEH